MDGDQVIPDFQISPWPMFFEHL